ncbi:MAG: hypothetical protein ACRDRH_15430 [Pseudonocardia sp.]
MAGTGNVSLASFIASQPGAVQQFLAQHEDGGSGSFRVGDKRAGS